uniref:Uncharacterized protein n=1 Tax=Rhipicephalus microplus TaxID=6941 RepID=A0A6G5AHI1_RHIMP
MFLHYYSLCILRKRLLYLCCAVIEHPVFCVFLNQYCLSLCILCRSMFPIHLTELFLWRFLLHSQLCNHMWNSCVITLSPLLYSFIWFFVYVASFVCFLVCIFVC